MPTESTLEQRFAKLTRDLCESNRSAAELPASTVLPFVAALQSGGESGDEARDRVIPNVLFHVEQLEMNKNRNLVKLKVEMVCQAHHNDTPETTQSDWTRKLRGIVNDRSKWAAHLSALSDADKAGFRILRYIVESGGITIDPDTKVCSFNTSIAFHVVTDELCKL